MSSAPSSDRPQILVIDDDRKLCRLIAEYLSPLGYAVSAVHTGPDGVEKATAAEWHAVILDLMLPGLDGFEVLKRIRKSSDVPVLMLTARGDEALVLTPVEYDLLLALARARGRVKSREALIEDIRDRNYDVFDRSIDVHISALRKKLGDDAKNPRIIRTVRAAGYMMMNPDEDAR